MHERRSPGIQMLLHMPDGAGGIAPHKQLGSGSCEAPLSPADDDPGERGMGPCLAQELLERYVGGGCSAGERDTVEEHLSSCGSCQKRVKSTHPNTESVTIDSGPRAAVYEAPQETRVIRDDVPTRTGPEAALTTQGMQGSVISSESMFGGYKIIEELPRGGQALVYKALHLATKTNVAIKVLLPTLLASRRARYYFEREAELISSLDHPNIVSIHDSGIIHNQYYFVMHYVDGMSLDQYAHTQDLSARDRVMLFNNVCSAVLYAHQQGIIHRDLKFANILVDSRGEPHILDFGLAKAVGVAEQAGHEAVATMIGQWAGTLSTMSPEQAAGNPKNLDVRTDIYSLGVILYHMLTGQYPYEVTGSTVEVLRRIQEQEPVRPRALDRKFDSDIEAILLTALAKDPDQRYQSAADLRSDLENWLEGLPIRVRSVSTAYLVRKIIARHRYASAVVGLLLIIVLSFTYISLHLHISARRAKRESQAIAEQWTESVGDHSVFAGSIAFTYFLQLWHEGQRGAAAWAALNLPANSKEKRAAVFLLDPAPLPEKEAGFRASLSGQAGWFVEFIVGEQYRAQGRPQDAVQAYRRSYEALSQESPATMSRSDQWLARNVAANLYKLTGDGTPEGQPTHVQDAPQPMTQQGLPADMKD